MENFVFPDEITTILMKIEKKEIEKTWNAWKGEIRKNISDFIILEFLMLQVEKNKEGGIKTFVMLKVFISKQEAWIIKRKMLWPSPLVGGQNGTPVLGLCCFIWEKNGVKAFKAFTVNSYRIV